MRGVWFKKKKRFLWTPASWQGWVLTVLYVLLNIAAFVFIDSSSHSTSDTLINFVPEFVLYTLFLLFIIKHTEGNSPEQVKTKSKKG